MTAAHTPLGRKLEGRPIVNAADLRAVLIRRGIIRPDACDLAGVVTPIPWVDRPTCRLDDAGRAVAARTIARPPADPDRELHRQQPPPEWCERQKDEP